MTAFFRFPHTPHLAWLGPGAPRDDKVLAPHESHALLAQPVRVEEKVDGANVGISIDADGTLRAQNRGSHLTPALASAQFKPLFRWLQPRHDALADALFPDLMLFGEWCYAVHSVHYTRLPDWFLVFDVYDRSIERFWCAARRNALAQTLGLCVVPQLGEGSFDLAGLRKLMGQSRLTDGPAEGLYVRHDDGPHLVDRAKLVRPEFVQAIGEHWRKKALQTNALADPQGHETWR